MLTLTTDKSLLLPHNWINWQTNGFQFTNGTCPYISKNVPFNAYVTPIFVNTNDQRDKFFRFYSSKTSL